MFDLFSICCHSRLYRMKNSSDNVSFMRIRKKNQFIFLNLYFKHFQLFSEIFFNGVRRPCAFALNIQYRMFFTYQNIRRCAESDDYHRSHTFGLH